MVVEATSVTLPGWEVIRKLGEGSFGGVYEIRRTLPDGTIERAALKKLTVPKDQTEITELYAQSYDSESITAHFRERMQDLVREYSFMQKLGENPNVVHCQDLRTVQHDDGIGWDIYIRMELLTPLKLWLTDRYDERQVIRLGLNMCGALHGCHQRNIIHRDIKPENILVNEEGKFKLGDFGIAKVSEKTATGTLTGTYSYMAPEIANRQHYGTSADIYSLGLVMYWMMNERTLPFLPLGKKIPSGVQRQEAQDRRFSGEEIPAPINGSLALTKIVLKACAFDPKERYHTVQELAGDLKRHYQTMRTGKKSPANPIPAENRKPNTNVMEELGVTPEMLTGYPSRDPGSISRREAVSDNRGYYDASFREPSSGMDKRPPSKPMRDPKGRENGPNMKKWIFCSVVVCAILAFFCAGGYLLWTSYTNLQERNCQAAYTTAQNLLHEGKYDQAIPALEALDGYQDSAALLEKAQRLAPAAELEDSGRIAEAAMAYYRLGEREKSFALWDNVAVRDTISAGGNHTIGLTVDGTVVALGDNEYGQCDVGGWRDCVAVSVGYNHTVGLKAYGTVVAMGSNYGGRCDVSDWKDIVSISAGWEHTVGLKADGTVVAVGDNVFGQCKVSDWKDIVAVSAGGWNTIGLKVDGTVVAVGYNEYGQCDVRDWKDIVAISAGGWNTIGLKSDGTLVAVGNNEYGQCDVSDWKDIEAISAGGYHTVGLKSDGTLVAVGAIGYDQCNVSDWKDIVAISAGEYHTVGLKANGAVVAAGLNDKGQCEVSGWSNIKLPSISQERWDKLDAAGQAFEAQQAADYAAAEKLYQAGNYDKAIAAFETLGEYSDSAHRVLEVRYAKANELLADGNYDQAIVAFEALNGYEDSDAKITKARQDQKYAPAVELENSGRIAEAAMAFYALGDKGRSNALWRRVVAQETVSASPVFNTLGLKSDGTVMATGLYDYGQCNVRDWTDIIAVSVGGFHSVGLKSDGTVLTAGNNLYGQCDVNHWSDIAFISSGQRHTVGLKTDGTVVAVGRNDDGRCDVSGWQDCVAVSAGDSHTVGLKADGTVVAVGDNSYGQCDVSNWKDIVAISAGGIHTVGLKADGTVVAVGDNEYGQCEVSGWRDCVAISAGGYHTVGLKADGTVVAVGWKMYSQCNVGSWSGILAVSAGYSHTVGLKSDGTAVAVGRNVYGECQVTEWREIKLPVR